MMGFLAALAVGLCLFWIGYDVGYRKGLGVGLAGPPAEDAEIDEDGRDEEELDAIFGKRG